MACTVNIEIIYYDHNIALTLLSHTNIINLRPFQYLLTRLELNTGLYSNGTLLAFERFVRQALEPISQKPFPFVCNTFYGTGLRFGLARKLTIVSCFRLASLSSSSCDVTISSSRFSSIVFSSTR